MKQALPIDAYIPDILAKLQAKSNLVLKAPPGTGKTTRVPPALMSAHNLVWVVVPRRLAAKSAAQRIAQEQGWKIGEEVGYHFRFERRASAKTKILFITEGMFFKLIQNELALQNLSTIVLDEFHERHLHADLILNYASALQKSRRPDLKIIVMSATLQGEKLLEFLPQSVLLEIQEKTHPLEFVYLADESPRLEQKVSKALQKALAHAGDILIFLPGQAEIRRCQAEIMTLPLAKNLQIQTLFGDLPWEEQQKIFEKSAQRKVILSTNIAESSLTIPGIRIVIDSGLHREASFSAWNGLPKLATRPISQASAIQRAGRAAREDKGLCIRLYSEHDFKTRPSHEKPEIQRADITQSLLEIFSLPHLENWRWFEEPPPAHLAHALTLLYDLDAIESQNFPASLSDMGRKMAALSLHPRLSRSLLECEKDAEIQSLSLLCAALSESTMEVVDARDFLNAKQHSPSVLKLQEQILNSFNLRPQHFPKPRMEKIASALLKGFPDAVAQKRRYDPREETELILCQGSSVYSKPHPFLKDSHYFLILEAQNVNSKNSTKNILRLCLSIAEETLLDAQHWLREEKVLAWNSSRKSILEREGLYYGQLVLEEKEGPPRSFEKVTELFLKEALGIDEKFWEAKLDFHDFIRKWEGVESSEELEQSLARILLLRPDLSLKDLVFKSLQGVYRLKDLEESPPSERFVQCLSAEDQSKLHNLLPTHATLAKGRKAKIHYRLGQNPWLASRLQDFLGVKNFPKLLGGKIPLTYHLLAPNQRPVQVTQDLESFWKNTYPELRPQLSRRYPRHEWPENPF